MKEQKNLGVLGGVFLFHLSSIQKFLRCFYFTSVFLSIHSIFIHLVPNMLFCTFTGTELNGRVFEYKVLVHLPFCIVANESKKKKSPTGRTDFLFSISYAEIRRETHRDQVILAKPKFICTVHF